MFKAYFLSIDFDMFANFDLYLLSFKTFLDIAIGRIYEACKKNDYILMVTADHGNAEKMIAPDGSKHTAHTCNLGMPSIFHIFFK